LDIPSLPGADHIVVKMADLFKLTLTPGNPLHEHNARRSLREEEELYELVDRDWTGLDGIEIGVDAITEAVLGT
jgi:hypothetical protein